MEIQAELQALLDSITEWKFRD